MKYGQSQVLDLIPKRGRLFLFLDYDGTLVPIAPTPEKAQPSTQLLTLLEKLCDLPGTRVAIVSGRSIDDLKRFLPVSGLYLVGVHGLVIVYPTGETVVRGSEVANLQKWVKKLAKKMEVLLEGKKGFLIEKKDFAVAVHYRLADPSQATAVLRHLYREIKPIVEEAGFIARSGKKVLEFGPAFGNKGDAVNFLLSQWPGAVPIYIGDDETDEDAFQVIAGKGWGILVAEHHRATKACFRLQNPQEVAIFLKEICCLRVTYNCTREKFLEDGEN